MRYAFEHVIMWILLSGAGGYAAGWIRRGRRERRLSPRAREARQLVESVEKLLR